MSYEKIIIQLSLLFEQMFLMFLFKGYLTRTSRYLEIISLFNLTHMMSMVNLEAIGVETLMIYSGYSLDKKFI